jgi:hypothetical protein
MTPIVILAFRLDQSPRTSRVDRVSVNSWCREVGHVYVFPHTLQKKRTLGFAYVGSAQTRLQDRILEVTRGCRSTVPISTYGSGDRDEALAMAIGHNSQGPISLL